MPLAGGAAAGSVRAVGGERGAVNGEATAEFVAAQQRARALQDRETARGARSEVEDLAVRTALNRRAASEVIVPILFPPPP